MSLKMKDMRKSSEEMLMDGMAILGPRDEYPCGLCITLDAATMEKLGVDHHDWECGDIFDLRAMAKVTGIFDNQTDKGDDCRVTLQIIQLGAESEDDEA